MSRLRCPIAAAVAFLVAASASAQQEKPSEAEQLRADVDRLTREYDRRIQDLEKRLREVEAAPDGADSTTQPATSPAHVAGAAAADANAAAARFADEQYQRSTEARERAMLEEEHPIHERIEQVLQDFIDIHGYFRAGYGRDDQGGPQVGFQAPGAFSKYRLGNEAENYGELGLGKNFYVPNLFALDARQRPDGTPTGPIARVQALISFYNPYQDLLSSESTQVGLPEVWASIGNVLEAQPSMKFWAGSRYYRRHDIHISDFYFYNMSGTGGGIEDVQLPFGKLACAWIGAAASSGFSDLPEPDPDNKAGFSKSTIDLRLYDVPLPLGQGEFGLALARATSGRDADGHRASGAEGIGATFLHTREQFLGEGGVNKCSLQFGTGPAKTFTSGFETVTLADDVFIQPDARDSWRLRVTEHFVADVDDHFSIGPAFVYQLTDPGDAGSRVHWASGGVRPIVRLNTHISVAFEGGVDWVKDEELRTSDYLYKLTLAPQVSLGGRFMSRPVIRAFVTFAGWGTDFEGRVGGNDYLNETSGLTYGVQMEAWW
jgi:maltoporin